jgi:hypothetical protein
MAWPRGASRWALSGAGARVEQQRRQPALVKIEAVEQIVGEAIASYTAHSYLLAIIGAAYIPTG